MKMFSDDIDNLNSYNLSNHFNNHSGREKIQFWRNLRDSEGLYELSIEDSKRIFENIKIGLGESK